MTYTRNCENPACKRAHTNKRFCSRACRNGVVKRAMASKPVKKRLMIQLDPALLDLVVESAKKADKKLQVYCREIIANSVGFDTLVGGAK